MRKKFGSDLTIIIPSAGIGRRMKSHGAKPLIDLSVTETVIVRQLKILKEQYPRSEIIIVLGFQSDKIARSIPNDLSVKIVENELYEDTNVSRSIGMALRVATHSNVLIVYGDLVFNKETFININPECSTMFVDSQGQIENEEIGVTVVGGYATRFAYGLPLKWAQIIFLNGRELQLFRNVACDKDKRKLHTFEIFNNVIEAGGKIKVIEPKGMKIVEIDSSKDIENARKIL